MTKEAYEKIAEGMQEAIEVAQGQPALVDLPKSQWKIKRCGPDHAIVGMHTNGGAIYWTKFALVDLPNDFIGDDDLKRILVDEVHVPTV